MNLPPGDDSPPRPPRSFWWALAGIFLLALILRLAYFDFVRHGDLMSNYDSRGYIALANALSERGEYTCSQTQFGFPQDLLRPPGYPFFLALLNGFRPVELVRTALLQSIVGALWVAVFTWLVASLTTPTIGILSGVAYAAEYLTISETPLPLSDVAYPMPQTLAVFLFLAHLKSGRAWQAVLSGVALGMAALVRPQAMLLLAAMLVAWLLAPQRRRSAALVVLAFALCTVPWMARNHARYGMATMSTVDSALLDFFTAHSTLYDGPSDQATFLKWLDDDFTRTRTAWEKISLTPAARRQAYVHEAIGLLKQHPFRALKQSLYGAGRTALGSGQGSIAAIVPSAAGWRWYRLVYLQIFGLWGLALLGSCRGKELDRAGIALLVISVALVVLAPQACGFSRYRIPAEPFLCMMAAMGAAAVWRSVGRKSQGKPA